MSGGGQAEGGGGRRAAGSRSESRRGGSRKKGVGDSGMTRSARQQRRTQVPYSVCCPESVFRFVLVATLPSLIRSSQGVHPSRDPSSGFPDLSTVAASLARSIPSARSSSKSCLTEAYPRSLDSLGPCMRCASWEPMCSRIPPQGSWPRFSASSLTTTGEPARPCGISPPLRRVCASNSARARHAATPRQVPTGRPRPVVLTRA